MQFGESLNMNFNPTVHLVRDDRVESALENAIHRRRQIRLKNTEKTRLERIRRSTPPDRNNNSNKIDNKATDLGTLNSSQTSPEEFTPSSIIKVEAIEEEQDVDIVGSIFGGGSPPNSAPYYGEEKIDADPYSSNSMESFAMETSSCQEMTTLTLHYEEDHTPLSTTVIKSSHKFSSVDTASRPSIFVGGAILDGKSAFQSDQVILPPSSGENNSPEPKSPDNLPRKKKAAENCVLNERNLRRKTNLPGNKPSQSCVRNRRTFHCSVCDRGFSTRKNRVAHEIVMCNVILPPDELKRSGVRKCPVEGCGKLLLRESDLNVHILSMHEGLHPYECSACGEKFTFKRRLILHDEETCKILVSNRTSHRVESTNSDPPESIKLANKIYLNKSKSTKGKAGTLIGPPVVAGRAVLNSKQNTISLGEKEINVISCDEFPSFGVTCRETTRATNRKPVKTIFCGYCVQVFYQPIKFYSHLVEAHGDIPKAIRGKHPCSVCGALLGSASECAGHEAVVCHVVHPPARLKELGVKIGRCLVATCGKMFWRENDLENHILTSHGGIVPHICPHCGSSFSLKATLDWHEKICGMSFSNNSDPIPGLPQNNEMHNDEVHREEIQDFSQDTRLEITVLNSNGNSILETQNFSEDYVQSIQESPKNNTMNADHHDAEVDKETQNFCEDNTKLTQVNSDSYPDLEIIKIEVEESSSYFETIEQSSSIDIVHSIFIGAGSPPPPTLEEEEDNVEVTINLPKRKAVPMNLYPKKKARRRKRKGGEIRKCVVCGMPFDNGSDLLLHVHAMHRNARCPCFVCGKVLSSPKLCAAHEVTKCNVTHSTDLLSKLGVITLPCLVEGCGKLFWLKDHRLMHVLKHHDGEGLDCFKDTEINY